MAINDKLNRIKEIKEDIKQALIDKGVEVTDEDSFGSYADKITNIPMEGGDPYYEELYNARTSNGTNMAGLFAHAKGYNLDLTRLDVSQCTDMSYMFDNCTVKDIDCSGWDVRNVINMEFTFSQCSSTINASDWDISNCTSLYHLFEYFRGRIDISNWDMNNVTLIENGFYGANLTNINGISELKLPKVTSLGNLFSSSECDTLDLSSWNTDNITSMNSTFSSVKIRKIDLSNWNTSKVTDMGYMFNAYNSYLEELIIPDWDMTNVTSKSSFFPTSSLYTKNLRYIDLSRSNEYTINLFATKYLPKRTESTYGDIAIPADSSQEVIDACIAKYWRPIGPSFNVESFQITSELDEVRPGRQVNICAHSFIPWYTNLTEEEIEYILSDESVLSFDENGIIIANGLGSCEIYARSKVNPEIVSNTLIINVSETDSTPYVIKFRSTNKPDDDYAQIEYNGKQMWLKNMEYDPYFKVYTANIGEPITKIKFGQSNDLYDPGITEILKFDFNGNNITAMRSMFMYCRSLTSIDVSDWDVSNVTDMYDAFSYCDSLTSLDVSNWNTSNVTIMFRTFAYCPLLETINIENWNTTNVEVIGCTFWGCSSLKSLDLSGWDTSKVSQTFNMFRDCTSLEYLNISTWNSSIFQRSNEFTNVPSTCQIYVGPNWTVTESELGFTGTFIRINPEYYTEYSIDSSTATFNMRSIDSINSGAYLPELSNGYDAVLLTLNDGSITTDLNTEANQVSSIKIYYPEETSYVKFANTKVKEVNHLSGSNITDCTGMFTNCVYLEKADLTSLDSTKVTVDTTMFEGVNTEAEVTFNESWDIPESDMGRGEPEPTPDPDEPTPGPDPETIITDFTISPESLTFSDDGNKTATVTIIPAETDKAVHFSYSIGSRSQFSITLDESESPNKYYYNIEATQLYKEEYEHMLTITEERSGITKEVSITVNSENVWVNPNAYVKVYYNRADGNYDNISANFYSGEEVPDTGFNGSDDNGQYADYWLPKGKLCRITVFEDYTTLASEEFTFTEDTTLWLVEGESTFRTEKPGSEEQEENPYYVEYTIDVADDCTETVGYANTSGTPYLPKINDEIPTNVTIKLKDGTTTTSLDTLAKDVESIKVDYDENTQKVIFGYNANETNCSKISGINYINFTNKITNMDNMFYICEKLTTLDVSNWDVSSVTSMSNAFSYSSLTTLDVSNWTTTSLTNIKSTFNGSSLTSLDLSNWDVSSVTSMSNAFYNCKALTSLDLSNWDVSSVTNMSNMFINCEALSSLKIANNWNTANVTTMKGMFSGCKALTTIDLSNWNTSKVTKLTSLFENCSALINVDLSGWNTSKVSNISYLFRSCTSLTSLNLSNWNTSKVRDNSMVFLLVPADVEWHYDGTNYANWTLTESQTNYSGTFPWNQTTEDPLPIE